MILYANSNFNNVLIRSHIPIFTKLITEDSNFVAKQSCILDGMQRVRQTIQTVKLLMILVQARHVVCVNKNKMLPTLTLTLTMKMYVALKF